MGTPLNLNASDAFKRLHSDLYALRLVGTRLHMTKEDIAGWVEMEGTIWIPDFILLSENPNLTRDSHTMTTAATIYILNELRQDGPAYPVDQFLLSNVVECEYEVLNIVKRGETYSVRIQATIHSEETEQRDY